MTATAIPSTSCPSGMICTPASKSTETGIGSSAKNDLTPQENYQATANTIQITGQHLTPAEMRLLDDLQQRDTKVRQHEMAHVAAGGRYITSGANFTYRRGPDGQNYAVGGEVSIDTSPVPGDPKATIQKMRQVKSAALAPADPSPQDLKVASKATSTASKALSDLITLQAQERAKENESQAFGTVKNAAAAYEKVNTLPEDDTPAIQIDV